jgi:hypothetical protein
MAVGIDNINIKELKVDIETFLKNPYLENELKKSVDCESVIEFYRAKYKGLLFRVNSRFVFVNGNKEYREKTLDGLENRYVMLEGSLHTYSNDGLHNYNDFNPQQGVNILYEWEKKFKIDLYNTVLNGLEFGVNIVIPFDCKLIFDNLICYKGLPFSKDKEGGEIFYSCVTNQFRIKIYDKGTQYGLPYNLLRFEIKVTTMQYLRTKGIKIKYLSDLFEIGIYEPMGAILLDTFNKILMGDRRLNKNLMTVKEREIYLEGNDPKTWEKIDRATGSQRKRMQRLERKYLNILDKYREGVNFKSVVAELIRAKSLELSTIYHVEDSVSPVKIVHYLADKKQIEKPQVVHYLDSPLNLNSGHSTDASVPTSTPPEKTKIKLCSGCGKPIDADRLYHSLECKERRDERNARSNDRNNFRGRYKKLLEKPCLFDVAALIKLNDKQREWIS